MADIARLNGVYATRMMIPQNDISKNYCYVITLFNFHNFFLSMLTLIVENLPKTIRSAIHPENLPQFLATQTIST